MMRLGAIFWLLLVLAAGFTTFKTKYAIQDMEDELTKVRKQTTAEQSEVRVLTAEWTFLNQPERLAELNKRFLNLGPVATKQLQERVEDVPLRTPPAPANLDQLVAATVDDTAAPVAFPMPPVTTVAAVAPAPAPVQPAVEPAARPRPAAVAATAPVVRQAQPRVQLAKASPPPSLDSLIAKIVEVR